MSVWIDEVSVASAKHFTFAIFLMDFSSLRKEFFLPVTAHRKLGADNTCNLSPSTGSEGNLGRSSASELQLHIEQVGQ
jgi:hypothetical protein